MMKSVKGVAILGLCSLVLAVYAQCDNTALKSECSGKLNNFIFVKSFNVTSRAKDFSYVFSKGTTYMISVCDNAPEGKNMRVTILDRMKKPIATNYLKKKDMYFPQVQFPCSATGIYYMKYEFPDGGSSCGVSVVGFKK